MGDRRWPKKVLEWFSQSFSQHREFSFTTPRKARGKLQSTTGLIVRTDQRILRGLSRKREREEQNKSGSYCAIRIPSLHCLSPAERRAAVFHLLVFEKILGELTKKTEKKPARFAV